MYKPRLEELEPRQVLNRGGFSPSLPSLGFPSAGSRVVEPVEHVPIGGVAGPGGSYRPTPDGQPMALATSMVSPGQEEPIRETPDAKTPGVARPNTLPPAFSISVENQVATDVLKPVAADFGKPVPVDVLNPVAAGFGKPDPVDVVNAVAADYGKPVLVDVVNPVAAAVVNSLPDDIVSPVIRYDVKPELAHGVNQVAGEKPDPTIPVESARMSISAGPSAPRDSADINRVVSAAPADASVGSVSQRVNAQATAHLDALTAVASFRLDAQSAAAFRSGALIVRDPDGFAPMQDSQTPGSPLPYPRLPSQPRPANADEEDAKVVPLQPLPQVSNVLGILPAPDVAALERGMQRFLGHLQRVGEDLAGNRDGKELGIWIIAGTAAAVACEIARRQLLRRPSAELILEVNWMPGSAPDPLFGE